MEQIMVSISCNTYNHEKYIADALDGFVSQKTTFPIEILVMDDASTDRTADIIREYEKKYPEIIKPIYQTVNQYSQGLRPGHQNRARAKGKYIAVCEGDDYWIDEYKLQKQVDYMEAHPDCTFCFTNAKILTRHGFKDKFVPCSGATVRIGQEDFDVAEIELLGFIPTASFLYRNGAKFPETSPGAYRGDRYMQLVMTNCGYAHFIDEPMVVYRRTDENSAIGQWDKDPAKYAKFCERLVVLYYDMKEITNHKYDDLFNYRMFQRNFYKMLSLKKACALDDKNKLELFWLPKTIGFRLIAQYYKTKYHIKSLFRH